MHILHSREVFLAENPSVFSILGGAEKQKRNSKLRAERGLFQRLY